MTNEAQEVAYALFKSMVEGELRLAPSPAPPARPPARSSHGTAHTEAVLRSEKAAREMGDEEVDAKHLERVLVQYLLDF